MKCRRRNCGDRATARSSARRGRSRWRCSTYRSRCSIRSRYRHLDRLPQDGPAIVVTNHVSHVDPFLVAKMIIDGARRPRFLAKDTIFDVFAVGAAMRSMGHIPVKRGTADARQSFAAAVEALHDGGMIVLHPEGTVTRDPDGWPMAGKTGAARLALLAPGRAGHPGRAVGRAGADRPVPQEGPARSRGRGTSCRSAMPIDLSEFRGRRPTRATLREVTDVIMRRLRERRRRTARRAGADRRAVRLETRRRERPPSSAPGRGGRRSRRCSPTPGRTPRCGPGVPNSPRGSRPNARNPDYLPGIDLPASVTRHARRGGCAGRCRTRRVRRAVAVAAGESRAGGATLLPADAVLVSLMKGVELGTAKRMSEVIAEVTGAPADRIVVVSGPNLAREIAERAADGNGGRLRRRGARRSRCSRRARRRTCARTRTPTSSAASSAARSRTSSRWPAASASAWASATTRSPR